MQPARLFVLGALVRHGPMHGHQIKRMAEFDHVDQWTNIRPGSLYGALHRMEAEGLVRMVRTEREGGRPPRTVYEITEGGKHEFEIHRLKALRATELAFDPIDLALSNVDGMDERAVRNAVSDRAAAIALRLQEMEHLREEASPYLSSLEVFIFEHSLRRLRVEVEWHGDLLAALSDLLSDPEPRSKEWDK